ncbi:hypothetical protein ACP26L_36560 (plasmid) [Paenibacillus sp. S-38]|uniref:hypothetical protein n=1 Tax=Paenibacillus sp. S-38 TaxID=3416710 RepID=UPI003CEE0DA4
MSKSAKALKLSHKKGSEFGVTLDLSRFLERKLDSSDISKSGEGTSYTICTTHGSMGLTAPGFEGVNISINVTINRKKYDEMVAAERAKLEAAQIREELQVKSAQAAPAPAPAPTISVPTTVDMATMMQQMQEMQMKIMQMMAAQTAAAQVK